MTEGGATPRPQAPRVIVTRVRPPRRRRDLLTRERLNAYISDNLERKLLLVSAPAGYGKTSLLVDYASASGLPVCWYRVEPADRDPVVFFEHVVGALRQRFPDTCPRTLDIVRSQAQEGQVNVADVVASLVNEIDAGIGTFFLFVLDDYQNIDDAARVNEAIDALLHYLPDTCQLVLAGRTVPRKLTLTRLAGAGLVAGIGQEQLRFTAPEIGRLVAATDGRRLSAMECELLARESEGWITALVLGGTRLLDGVKTSPGDHEQLFSFLAHEVMARQPEAVQSFLVRSAVLGDLSPASCDAVLDRADSAEMLSWLEDHNLFVTRLETDEVWLRYHQLFRDFLRARLAADLPAADAAALHRRAADWCARADRPAEEIDHLLAAGEQAAAAERMSDAVEAAHRQGQWQTIIDWAAALPEEILHTQPVLVQRLGTALTYAGDLQRAMEAFDWAVGHYEAIGDNEGLASVLVRRAVLYRRLGLHARAEDDAGGALELERNRRSSVAGMAHKALGGVLALTGRMEEAGAHLLEALVCFEAQGAPALVAAAHSDLSAIYQWSGDADLAIRHGMAARDNWAGVGNLGALALALNNLGTAFHQVGRFDAARDCLLEAVAVGSRSGYRRAEAMALISMGDLLGELGELAAAVKYLDRGVELADVAGDRPLGAFALATRAEVHRLLGNLDLSHGDLSAAAAALEGSAATFEAALLDFARGTLAWSEQLPQQALKSLRAASDAFGALGARREQAKALLHLASVLEVAGTREAWRRAEREAERVASAFGHPESLAPCRGQLASTTTGPAALPDAGPTLSRRRRAPGSAQVPEVEQLWILALGKPVVRVRGRSVPRRDWQSATARSLLFYLADRPDGASRDELMAAFWPDSDFVRARSSLHSALHRIRRAVGTADAIQTDFERYFVRWPGGVRYDVALFEEALSRVAGVNEDAARVAVLEEATSLARGEYMAGVLEEWCFARRRALEGRVVEAWLDLGKTLSRQGRTDAAVHAYERVLDLDAAHETAHRGLMAAYGQAGDRYRALRQFEACQQALAEELGVSPDRETMDLYCRIADQAHQSP